MKTTAVRIVEITIDGFKNVKHGSVMLEAPRAAGTLSSYEASVLGIYGQNGSGKTAVIDALAILKTALTGGAIPGFYTDYINVDEDHARFAFRFRITDTDAMTQRFAVFEFCLRRSDSADGRSRAGIFGEKLSWTDVMPADNSDKKGRFTASIDARGDDGDAFSIFRPKKLRAAVANGGRETETDLIVARKLAAAMSSSYIFSCEMSALLEKNAVGENGALDAYRALIEYGHSGLYVIGSGLIGLTALPLAYKYVSADGAGIGRMSIPLDDAAEVPNEAFNVLMQVVGDMNLVLPQLVPGMTITVRQLGEQIAADGGRAQRIALMSCKNNREIPLRCESEGIKKLVTVLQLLIVIYNDPSMTVAVDEIDAGVFEYLLGEILRIISEKGRGQLVFTSHNLRPLETLDRRFIAFTTTNPENRYIRLGKLRSGSNLRDFYYRDIVLGEQDEAVYDPTDNFEIALAMREAGLVETDFESEENESDGDDD